MLTLVVGTPDSGKSALAEELAVEAGKDSKKIYIATMEPYGEEGAQRVKKHREMRQGKNFETFEWPYDIAQRAERCDEIENATVLLECMSNLIGNELYLNKNRDIPRSELVMKILDSVQFLNEKSANLIVVTNSFMSEAESYDFETKYYIELTEEINVKLKVMADITFERIDGAWVRIENNK